MDKLLEYIINFKLKVLAEMGAGFGGVGGIFSFIFIQGDPNNYEYVTEPSLWTRAMETIILSGLGGIVGAIGGLLIAILWGVYGKKWVKKKFGVEVNSKDGI